MTDQAQPQQPIEDAGQSEVKSVDPGETQELRLLIDNNQVGGIIGKAGANVTRVREQTGIFLSILKAEVNATERVMVLKGQYEQLVEAIKMVAELLIEADAKLKKIEMPEGQTKVRLLVHRGAVGAVIGKGGNVIKETQHETGARVQVSHEALPQSTEKNGHNIWHSKWYSSGCHARSEPTQRKPLAIEHQILSLRSRFCLSFCSTCCLSFC